MNAERRNVAIGGAVLAALLASVIVPNFHRGAASLSHPDPVGPTAYSKSAIGHAAFYNLLDELGIETSISEAGSRGYVGLDDVLVIAEPRTDGTTLDETRVMLMARTVLLVLPKRAGKSDPHRPYWLSEEQLVSEAAVTSVLRLVDPAAKLARQASLTNLRTTHGLAGSPSIDKPQLIRSRAIRPLLGSADGMLLGEIGTRTGHVFVLSDPDLIANYNLTNGDNSVLAVNLMERLRVGHGDGQVVFDEFVHGFSPRPFHMLGILFQFPFSLVTAQIALATALLIWAATARFGSPLPLTPPMEAGKRSLIDNGSRLLSQSGRMAELSGNYFEEMVRDTGRSLRAPSGLEVPELLALLSRIPGAPPAPMGTAAPQNIWTWRKELLGESRPNAKLDR